MESDGKVLGHPQSTVSSLAGNCWPHFQYSSESFSSREWRYLRDLILEHPDGEIMLNCLANGNYRSLVDTGLLPVLLRLKSVWLALILPGSMISPKSAIPEQKDDGVRNHPGKGGASPPQALHMPRAQCPKPGYSIHQPMQKGKRGRYCEWQK
ncbi:MAG: hypothetical protein LBF65_03045 [Holosporales bacterium]|jgi:hypothetical protein|nr:hypothetical protein [Holosporales bacterium]